MSSPWILHVRHATWAAALALAAIGFAGGASAQTQSQGQPQAQPQPQAQGKKTQTQQQAEDDELEDHILNADKRMLNAILSPLGLGSQSGPDITYRERSPLVVPQGRDLPPPGKAARNGDWPVEPEVKEKRQAAAARKAGLDQTRMSSKNDEKPISGTPEMWKTAKTGTWDEERKPRQEQGFFSMMMQGKLTGSWTETGKFEGEPPRTSLVDPPPGYLTPSAAAPYGMTPRADTFEKKEPKL